MKLYATEYHHTNYDSGRKESLTVIEIQPNRFTRLMKENKGKRGFKGVYAI